MIDQQKKIDGCFSIENNKNALACLKELVSTAKGDCRPKLVLLTQERCIPCAEERELHKEDIARGIVQELSVNTPEGLEVAVKNEIQSIPALVLLDCKDKLILPSV